jgi:TolB-like protein/Flp pilus assembly protein TadD
MDLLIYLARQDSRVVSVDKIIDDLWPGKFVTDSSVYNCVTELRHALAEGQDGQAFIENIPKRGYRLIVPVSAIESDATETVAATKSQIRSKRVIGAAGTAALLIGVWIIAFRPDFDSFPVEPQGSAKSIAVLPFVNLSGAPENEYFSDGLTETLIHALAQFPDLKVSARTSAFFFKGKDIDIREIAEKLGVGTVLEGSVQREGNKVRIVAQLIEAESGFNLWSNTYDRELSDIFAVQDDIANSVSLAMKVTLAGDMRDRGGKIESVGTDNVAAYDKYLKGLQQKNISSNAPLLMAEISFKEALALDPGFYEARLELADTYWGQQNIGEITRAAASEYVTPLLDQLLEERPDDGRVLAIAIRIRGSTINYDAIDLEKNLAELTTAIGRMPNEARLYRALAMLLGFAKRQEEAIEWLDRGIAVDPLDSMLHARRGYYLIWAGDVDGADASFARAIELNPDNPSATSWAARVQLHRRQYAEWFALDRKAMALDPLDHELPNYIAVLLYIFGLMDEGDKYFQRAIAIAPDNAWVRGLNLYRLLLLDDHARARELSERMLRDDIDNRWGAYRLAVMVFVSTMTELGKTDEALTILEELQPGVSSPEYHPRSIKEHALQYYAVLTLAQSQSKEETLNVLDAVVPRWDVSFPSWRDYPGLVAPIVMARGQTEISIELTLKDLENVWDTPEQWPYLVYRHIVFYKALATEPLVVERLTELDAEAKKAGEEIRAYIVQNNLQL